ncbi:MAG: hypothetical protein WCR20_15000, partial [Verrucomicrobiota bacterium]
NISTGTIEIMNTAVVSIIEGTGITISSSNGDVTISSSGGGGSGVTSVGVASTTLAITNTPVISAGNINVNLPVITGVAGAYTSPTLTVDAYGRVTAAVSSASAGTVTAVAVTGGDGIQATGGPITTTGTINIINTGVTRLSAGTGISVSGSNGNVTISASVASGTVTSVSVYSSSLAVTGGTVTTSGTINVELPTSSENLLTGAAASLAVLSSYFTTLGASTSTLAAGSNGQVKNFMMVAHAGDMVITVTNAGWKSSGIGTATFAHVGDACTLRYVNSKWFCTGNNGVVFG